MDLAGSIPISDEHADRLRSQAAAALKVLESDPDRAIERLLGDLDRAAFPEPDLVELADEHAAVCRELVSTATADEVGAVMYRRMQGLVEWEATLEVWKAGPIPKGQPEIDHGGAELVVSSAPSTHQPFRQPRLAALWRIRAAGPHVADAWTRTTRRMPGSMLGLHDQLRADPTGGSGSGARLAPLRLRGSLGRAVLDGQEVQRWQLSTSSAYSTKRRDRAGLRTWSGLIHIHYLLDHHTTTVWVTAVELHAVGHRLGGGAWS